jgi:hypothetical protein
MPWLFPGDGNGEINSMFGITGKDFYGARMIYRDDELASINTIENYVDLVENGIDLADDIPNVTVNITVPGEEYDYSTYEDGSFQTAYPVLYTTIFDIAKVVYEVDNSSSYSGSSLIECANGILYFGFGEEAIEDVKEVVKSAILSNYSAGEGSGNVEEQISSSLETMFNDTKFNVRTEKLFVKDYIISGDDETIKGIAKQNYVAFIFMPKTNVTFTKFSFAVGGADLSEFTIELSNNGNSIALNKDDSNYGSAGNDGKKQDSYIYSSGVLTSESAGGFADIDVNNVDALSEGLSLFDIVQTIENYETYLELSTEAEKQECWTIKLNGIVAKMTNSEAFSFVEFETKWKVA